MKLFDVSNKKLLALYTENDIMKTRGNWTIEYVSPAAEKELEHLSSDLKAKFLYITKLLENYGPPKVGFPYLRPLENKLWEMRLHGKDNIARSIYILSTRRRIIILHTFIKKTQVTPARALKVAKRRLKEIKDDSI